MATFTLEPATVGLLPSAPRQHGDAFAHPLVQLYTAGSPAVSTMWAFGLTREAFEDAEPLDVPDGSGWVAFVSPGPGSLHFMSSNLTLPMSIWGGASDAPSQLTDETLGSTSVVAVQAGLYYVRLRPENGEKTVSATALFAERTAPPIVLGVLNNLITAPGYVKVTLSNVPPGPATLSIVEAPEVTERIVTVDQTGVLFGYTFAVDSALANGTYTLSATLSDGRIATGDFDVLYAQQEPITPPEAQVLPTLVYPPPEVPTRDVLRRWVVVDMDGGPGKTPVEYYFGINPTEMASPFATQVLTLGHSTAAVGGQHLTWQGAEAAVQWTFNGYTFDEETYDKFVALLALNRRVYLVDHLSQVYVVSFESLDFQEVRNIDNKWLHTYTFSCLVWSGPTEAGS